jgi:hypothetical protein
VKKGNKGVLAAGQKRDGKMGVNTQRAKGAGYPAGIPPPIRNPKHPVAPEELQDQREVQLHKAEDAWRPSFAWKRDNQGNNEEAKDKEELTVEVWIAICTYLYLLIPSAVYL